MKWVIDYLYPRNFSIEAIPSLDGKVVLVTGGCSGLGYEIATQCALHNARRILIVSLASQRLNEAVQTISVKLTNPLGQVDSIPTDLADLASVFRAVDSIRSVTQSIDVVFANAGISRASAPLSPNGLETVFATNHVGHYALITRILPILIQTASYPDADVRVVITSSSLAWYARRIDFPSLHTPFTKEKGKLIDMYTRSKLANLLFGLKLADYVREQGSTNIFVNIGEPGIIFGTDVHRQMETTYTFWTRMWVAILNWLVGLSVQDGALTLLFLGTSPTIREEAINGRFYRPFGDLIPCEKYPKWATGDLAKKLWDWSEEFVSRKETELNIHSNT